MKIQLEQKSNHCPDHLSCVACEQRFMVGQLRQLLKDDRSLLHGDICPTCSGRSATEIQDLLQAHGNRLLSGQHVEQERGQELIAIAQEPVQFPSIWQWLVKKIEILAAESNTLEQARFNIKPSACNCRQLQSLEYMYQESEIASGSPSKDDFLDDF